MFVPGVFLRFFKRGFFFFFFNLSLIFPRLLPLSGTCLPCFPLDLLCSRCYWSPFCNREHISVRMLTPLFNCSRKFLLYKRCMWPALQNIRLTIFATISLLHYCCYLCCFSLLADSLFFFFFFETVLLHTPAHLIFEINLRGRYFVLFLQTRKSRPRAHK